MKKGRVKTQCSFYGTKEIIQDILNEAHEQNLSFSDYLTKLHKEERIKSLDEKMDEIRTKYSIQEISWDMYVELLHENEQKINQILGG